MRFHSDNSKHVYSVLLTSLPPPLYFHSPFLPPPLLKQSLVGCIIVSSYVSEVYFEAL
jgi:hypothetical protein